VDIGLISPASIAAYGKTLETGKMFANLRKHLRMQGRTKTGINTDEV
jgi:hypothetical protein